MIDLDRLTIFITQSFQPEQLYVERFKEDVLLVDIDCLKDNRKLSIRATDEKAEFSTVSKEPEIDFSLYDYNLNEQGKVERMIKAIKEGQRFLFQTTLKMQYDII